MGMETVETGLSGVQSSVYLRKGLLWLITKRVFDIVRRPV
jgi:hypothetical protein